MITNAGWKASGKSFTEIAKAGDEVDKEIYDWFFGCVPPRHMGLGSS